MAGFARKSGPMFFRTSARLTDLVPDPFGKFRTF